MVSHSIATKVEKPFLTLVFVLRLLLMVAALALVIIPHLIFLMLKRPSPMVMAFLNAVGWLAGLRTRLRRDVLFVSNHLSWLDILSLGGAARSAFVSKAEIGRAPLVGWLADQNQTLYVERAARRDIGQQTAQLRDALASGRPVTLFPEGTTGDGHALLPFRPALFQAVIPTPPNLQVQPVYLDYGPDATDIAWLPGEGGLDNFRRILSRLKPIHLTIHYLEPLDDAVEADRKQLADAARATILDAMTRFSCPSARAPDRL
jgi:lyso-ornithine lipid O-acyltransferase